MNPWGYSDAVLHGEYDGGQIALGGVGEAVSAISLEGLLDLVVGRIALRVVLRA